MVLLLFGMVCWVGVRRLSYPEFVEFARLFSRPRIQARLRLQESLARLRAARTGPELWEELQANAGVLDLDRVELRLPPERRARLRLPVDLPDYRDGFWRLHVPLAGGGELILQRRPRALPSDVPLELLAEELPAALEHVAARLEQTDSLEPAPAEPSPPSRRWAPSEKGAV